MHSLLIFPVSAAINKIPAGGQFFIGESDLDITSAIGDSYQIAWWGAGSDSKYDQPDDIQTVSNPNSFFVDPDIFKGKIGNWYQWDNNAKVVLAFNIQEPELDIEIWDGTLNKEITNGEILIGNFGNFLIITNMGNIVSRPGYYPGDAPFKIKVLGEDGTRYYDFLIGTGSEENSLINLAVNRNSWYWVSPDINHNFPASVDGWNTAALNNLGEPIYELGFYTVWVECNANGMKDNYQDPFGGAYPESTIKSVTLVSSNNEKPLSSSNLVDIDLNEKPKIDSINAESWYKKGKELSDSGYYEDAVESYKNAIIADPKLLKSWSDLGYVLLRLGRYEEAINACDQAIQLKPDYDFAWMIKGYNLFELKRYEEALNACDKVIRIEPDDEFAWSLKVDILDAMGNSKEADIAREKVNEFE